MAVKLNRLLVLPNRRPLSRLKQREMMDTQRRRVVSISEFLTLPEDLKNFAYSSDLVKGEDVIRKIDNTEKIGYYRVTTRIVRGASNCFYRKSSLHQWIVYNRKTKKGKISSTYDTVFSYMMNDLYYKSDRELIMKFLRKPTGTLCKKILTGKMTSIGDFVAYYRSYVLRRKDLSVKDVFNFMIHGNERLLHIVENPQDLETLNQITDVDLRADMIATRSVTCRIEDLTTLNKKYDEWTISKGDEYDSFLRQRDGESGDSAGQGVSAQASGTVGKVPGFTEVQTSHDQEY